MGDKSFVTALVLILVLGGLGAHRFYVGKPGTAILFILTGGCLLYTSPSPRDAHESRMPSSA